MAEIGGSVPGVVVGVLGALEVHVDGVPLQVGPVRRKAVLAALLVDANRVVPPARLLDRVWGERPPARARPVLRTYLSALRRALEPTGITITWNGTGYRLSVEPELVDLHRFRGLLARARAGADAPRALGLVDEALALWRGEPLAELDTPWALAERERLTGERAAARAHRADLALECGGHAELLPELTALAAEHPLDERVAGQLVLALHRSGRRADALEHYRRTRDLLAEELGVDPGAALRRLHRDVLTAEQGPTRPPREPTTGGLVSGGLVSGGPAVGGTAAGGPVVGGPAAGGSASGGPVTGGPAAVGPMTGSPATCDSATGGPATGGPVPSGPASTPAPGALAAGVPRQLPAPPAPFVGRGAELDRLDSAFADARRADAMPVVAIAGGGGVGKTWLALRWAHRNADLFPDGQLFADLRGFSPDAGPLDPATAVRGFLDVLGVDPDRVPPDLEAGAARYRSLLAGRRVLVVLDNAATAEQVRPLLPGSPTCAVLVTGRTALPSLIDRHGARHLPLGVLTRDEAHALVAARVGADRLAADPAATAELVDLCWRHPLALAIMARHIAARPSAPLAEFTDELHELGLDLLDDDDPAASLPVVLSWSLRSLTPEQRTAFALLGTAPGPDIGLPAAAALTAAPDAETRRTLRTLEGASLVERRPRGRYAMHDLVRAHAAATARDGLTARAREAALLRFLDFHTHTARAADRLLNPHRRPIELAAPAPGVRPHPLPDARAALAWFDAEHACLLAGHRAATATARHPTVWNLTRALDTFHTLRGHRRDRLATWRAAADAAGHLPDPTAPAHAHRALGLAHTGLGQQREAITHLDRALAHAERLGDPVQRAQVHSAFTGPFEHLGEDRAALAHARRAVELYRGLAQPAAEAEALNLVGWYSARLGDHTTARAHCEAALELHRGQAPSPDGEANTLDTLGYIARGAGDHAGAIGHYRRALALYREHGYTYQAPPVLDVLGDLHAALGERGAAVAAWRECLALLEEQDRRAEADRVRRKLAEG
ncbi:MULTISPECIES: BTAD domain-containing putative transcriptional regulator [Actinosynnema]|uniref:AfsR/SARP family transcriptional regulator n=1 Tax=Actinosynnema TaxID=40566 RepID=UPI0020A5B1D8|nr:BTAD domain-containing putative transcriptional regulator [Actinosynnema pretiosum]MCP2097594.1 DNA-binding transcriptional activator of the SARP family [Actinosynnema pretiosum]